MATNIDLIISSFQLATRVFVCLFAVVIVVVVATNATAAAAAGMSVNQSKKKLVEQTLKLKEKSAELQVRNA
jgi:Tfp pilus assembly protein PilO